MKETKNIKRIALYLRVASVKITNNEHALLVQQENIERFCAAKNINLDEKLLYLDVASGGAFPERQALSAVMESARKKRIDAVVVSSLDRISRNIHVLLGIIRELEHYNVTLYSATESFDSSASSGLLLLNMLTTFAQCEREVIRERTRRY